MSRVIDSRLAAVAVAGALALAGCSPSSTAAPSAEASAAAGVVDPCPIVDLRGPDGIPLDLTGSWSGPFNMLWLVTQVRSCAVFEGFGTEAARAVYSGTVSPDFTIEGLWVWAWSPPGPEISTGEFHWVDMQVEFDASGEPIILVQGLDIAPRIGGEPFTITMERFSPTTEFNPFP